MLMLFFLFIKHIEAGLLELQTVLHSSILTKITLFFNRRTELS